MFVRIVLFIYVLVCPFLAGCDNPLGSNFGVSSIEISGPYYGYRLLESPEVGDGGIINFVLYDKSGVEVDGYTYAEVMSQNALTWQVSDPSIAGKSRTQEFAEAVGASPVFDNIFTFKKRGTVTITAHVGNVVSRICNPKIEPVCELI